MTSFSQINWLSTMKVTFARGLASTIVLVVAALAGLHIFDWQILAMWPFIAVLFVTAFHFLLRAVSYMAGNRGLNAIVQVLISVSLFFVSLLVACGDPLVYWLNRVMPALLNVETGFKLFNFVPLFIVYNPE